ncbi:MAG: hypothetical protein GJ676_01890 [Rhodobacteraceae bacterium]|nr:hypothetical protein [Paracoccaceae bacterium]
MPGHRIHIFGASGSGTSTLGRALAGSLASQHFDSDDFYWLPTDPPFTDKRRVADRVNLMEQVFLPRRDWVLSGSLDSWSDGIAHRFTLAVFVELETKERLTRLEAREERRLGGWASATPGERAAVKGFLDWAAGYDTGVFAGRSRDRHLHWMQGLACPVMHLNAAAPVEDLVSQILQELD